MAGLAILPSGADLEELGVIDLARRVWPEHRRGLRRRLRGRGRRATPAAADQKGGEGTCGGEAQGLDSARELAGPVAADSEEQAAERGQGH